MRVFTCLSAVFFVCLTGPLLALTSAKPKVGEIMLVIGPDPSVLRNAIEAAGGRFISPETARFGVLALSEEENFAKALIKQGAWFVADGRRVAVLCGYEV